MGFLIKQFFDNFGYGKHGHGTSSTGPQVRTPLPGITTTIARTPTIVLGGAALVVTPLPAISTTIAKTPAVSVGGSGAGLMGSNGAVPLTYDDPSTLANDAAFRAKISSSISAPFFPAKAGTGNASSYYNGGIFADLIEWKSNVGPTSGPGYECTYLAQNVASSTPCADIEHFNQPQFDNITRIWLARQVRHQVGWTNVGDATSGTGISFNSGQGQGFKTGPWAGYDQYDGRAGTDMAGTQYDLGVLAVNKAGSPNYGIVDSVYGNVSSEFTDGLWYDEVDLLEGYFTGGKWYAIGTKWRKLTSDPISSYVRTGPRMVNEMVGIPSIPDFVNIQWTSKNYNQSRSTNLTRWLGIQVCWNAANPNNDGSDDPFGCLARDNSHAAFPPVSTTLISKTASTATFDIRLTRDYPFLDASYAKGARPVIDGVDTPGQDQTIPYIQSEARISGNNDKGVFRCTINLTTGLHTVAFKLLNGVGTTTTATSSVNVTI